MKKILGIVLAGVVALTLAACGDDDAPGGATGPATEATAPANDWVTKADVICADANEEEAAQAPPPPGSRDPKQLDLGFVVPFNEAGRDALEQLEALPAPEQDRAAVERFLASMETVIETMDKRIAALRAKNESRADGLIGDYQQAVVDMGAAAGAAGLTNCQSLGI